MKKINLLFITISVIALGVFNSCDKDDDEEINLLIGTWAMTEVIEDETISVKITFNADFSGVSKVEYNEDSYIYNESENFTYGINGDVLTIVSGSETDVLTFSITGNVLTISDEEEDVLVLTKI